MELRFRRKVFLRFGLLVWCAYAAGTAAFLVWHLYPGQHFTQGRRAELMHQVQSGKGQMDRERELVESLRQARATGRVDFFGWQRGGAWIFEGQGPALADVPADGHARERSGYLVAVVGAGDLRLAIGVGIGWEHRLRALWRQDRFLLLKDGLFLLLGALVLVAFFFQELLHGLSFKSGAEAVPSAPRKARASSPPTAAHPWLLAVADRRGALGAQELERMDEVVYRHGGESLLAEGDLLLWGFASAEAGLSAARDFRFAEPGYPALLHPGPAQVFTAAGHRRVRADILGKARAWLWAGEPRLLACGIERAPAGFRASGEPPRLRLDPEGDAAGFLAAGDYVSVGRFRDDASIQIMLEHLGGGLAREDFLAVVGALRGFRCRHLGADGARAYGKLLAQELATGDAYRLSATLALGTCLLAPPAANRELEELFLQALASHDRRVKANAIEILTHLYPQREFMELRSLVRHFDNRISANALIKAALERFDEKLVAKLEERLRGGSVAHVASALYATGEIAHHYHRRDSLYLSTKPGFLKILADLPAWVAHPSPMVRRQAMVAARKAADRNLDARFEEIFRGSQDPELLELFAAVYGWHKEKREAA